MPRNTWWVPGNLVPRVVSCFRFLNFADSYELGDPTSKLYGDGPHAAHNECVCFEKRKENIISCSESELDGLTVQVCPNVVYQP